MERGFYYSKLNSNKKRVFCMYIVNLYETINYKIQDGKRILLPYAQFKRVFKPLYYISIPGYTLSIKGNEVK